MINNNIDLWYAMVADNVSTFTEEEAKALVENAVYKYSECGCSYTSDSAGVSLTGYAEGSNAELPVHGLGWGFTYDEFNETLAEADAEGVAEWHIANGE
jgi:hypothetical protein